MTDTAVRVVDATKTYGEGDASVTALRGVSADFASGRFSAIMGPSGSGKSTLLHCLAGLDALDSGSVFLGDTELGSLSDKELTLVRREQIGFVFQAFNLVGTLTAKENILLPLSIAGEKPDQEWYEQVIKAVDLGDRLTHRPSELSGGQQQRVASARALVTRPKIVFADEPSGNLDSKSSAELLDFMKRAVDDFGQTIVMVTHDPFSASHADEIVFLDDGNVVDSLMDPTVDSVLDKMRSLGD